MKNKSVLIIDLQEFWRAEAALALQAEGYQVYISDKYLYPVPGVENPDLIVLGCSVIRREESQFIQELLNRKLHLLVLSSSLPWSQVRPLFLGGVEDVSQKPFRREQILKTVEEVFQHMLPKDAFHERRLISHE